MNDMASKVGKVATETLASLIYQLDPTEAGARVLQRARERGDFNHEKFINERLGTPEYIIEETKSLQQAAYERGKVSRDGIPLGRGQVGKHAAWYMLPFIAKAMAKDGILETKHEGNYNLLKAWAESLKGWIKTHDIGYLKHTQELTSIFSTIGNDSLQALKGTVYQWMIPKNPGEHVRPAPEPPAITALKESNGWYHRVSQPLRALNARAEEGVVVERNGRQYGISIVTYVTAPKMQGSLTPEEEMALQQDTIREMQAQHPNRIIKKVNIQSVTEAWGHMNSLPVSGQIGPSISTDQYVAIVMFETSGEIPTGINRFPAPSDDMQAGKLNLPLPLRAGALAERRDNDSAYLDSEDQFQSLAQAEARLGRYADNGLGLKCITRFASPDQIGGLCFYDHLWIFCNDIAEELFVNDLDRRADRKLARIASGTATQAELDGKESDVWDGIKTLLFGIKKTGMRNSHDEGKSFGEALGGSLLPSYEFKLNIIMKDVTMIGNGNFSEIPKTGTMVEAITGEYRKQLKEYGIWDGYIAPNGMRYRYLEWDGDDHRAGHQKYHEQDLFFANLVANEFQKNLGDTEIVACQLHFDPNDENADPGYINNRRRLWLMTWNPAYANMDDAVKPKNWMNRYAEKFYELQAKGFVEAGQQCFEGVDVEGDGTARVSYLECPAMPQNIFDTITWKDKSRFMTRRYGLAWSATMIMDWCMKYPDLWPRMFSDQVFGWHNGPQQEPSIGYRFLVAGTQFDKKTRAGYIHPMFAGSSNAVNIAYGMKSEEEA